MVAKDASKRLGENLPDTRATKRTLGDITNRTTFAPPKGKNAKAPAKTVKAKGNQVSSENAKPVVKVAEKSMNESKISTSSDDPSMYVTATEMYDR